MSRPRRLLALIACSCPLVATADVHAQQPVTERASVSSTGAQATGGPSSAPTVSANGRWVVFRSEATDLVAGDTNGAADVFLRDRLSGVTQRLSVGAGGVQANGSSGGLFPTISDDGRTVVFDSSATNLAPAASPASTLFVADVATGAVRNLPGAPAPYTGSASVTLSGNGVRYAFRADAPTADVFVGDVATGVVRRVSQTAAGVAANGGSARPRLSQDGRVVVFSSGATNLVPADTNGFGDVFAVDLTGSGAPERVSVNSGGGEGNARSWWPAVSGDGCIVAFTSSATNLSSPAPGTANDRVYVRDRCQGQTTLVSVDANGAPAEAVGPSIAADGCLVVYESTAVSPPTGGSQAAVLRDRCAGQTSRLDLATDGTPGNASVSPFAISATGRYAAFDTIASTLVPGDTNATTDVFVRDRATNRKPTAELTATAAGRTVTADATASGDVDGPTVSASIAWGDGTPDSTGLQATHTYARGGTYSVTVTVTDSDGATSSKAVPVTVPDPPPAGGTAPTGAGGTPTGPAGAARPALRGVRLASSSFRVVAKGRKPSRGRGTTLSLTLSTAATVRLRFDRALPGRRAGRRCKAGGRRGKRCTVFRAAGRLSRDLRAGAGTVPITGRIGRKALKPGRYRLRVDATGDGGTSAVQTLSFSITD